MNDIITDYEITEECKRIAKEALEESDGDFETARDYISDTIDGHEWVIYTHNAMKICTFCNTDEGEAFLEEIGMPNPVTLAGIVSLSVYGEMQSRANEALQYLENIAE